MEEVDGKGIVERIYRYMVVVSQDCDLEQSWKPQESTELDNQYTPNVLLLPAFLLDEWRVGEHLSNLFQIKQRKIGSDEVKQIKRNENKRYHYLPKCNDHQLPELIIDFKLNYVLPRKYIIDSFRPLHVATIDDLFRENLSLRFASYISRIPTPTLSAPESSDISSVSV